MAPMRRKLGRTCCGCGRDVGGSSAVVQEEADRSTMLRLRICRVIPRSGAMWFVCSGCAAVSVGLDARLAQFACKIAAGFVHFVQRTLPQAPELRGVPQEVRQAMRAESFVATRHGAAHYALD